MRQEGVASISGHALLMSPSASKDAVAARLGVGLPSSNWHPCCKRRSKVKEFHHLLRELGSEAVLVPVVVDPAVISWHMLRRRYCMNGGAAQCVVVGTLLGFVFKLHGLKRGSWVSRDFLCDAIWRPGSQTDRQTDRQHERQTVRQSDPAGRLTV